MVSISFVFAYNSGIMIIKFAVKRNMFRGWEDGSVGKMFDAQT